jgi:type II secretion system protein C
VHQRIRILLKSYVTAWQQKFDLANANIPPFSVFARWFAVGAFAVVLSAAVNMMLVKYVFFEQIKTSKKSGRSAGDGVSAAIKFAERPKADEYKEILKRNIFNSEQREEVSKEASTQTQCAAVKSDLPLKFTGVIFGGTKETSLVLLESTATKQADTFIFNDVVPGEAKIVDIQRDKVFFERDGSGCPEFLDLQQPEVVKRRVPGVARSQSSGLSAGNSAPGLEFSESGFTRSKDGNIVADRRWVDKALTSDFAKTLQDAKASPNLVNGEVKGFVLTRIRPDSVYEKMGFQDGDVVETINGIDLNDAARAIQTLNSLRQENAIELNIKRNGVSMPLKIQVK